MTSAEPVSVSITLLHHRPDLYQDPLAFRPELARPQARYLRVDPVRRRHPPLPRGGDDPEPERALHRNVTMIPARGGRVVLRRRD